MVASAARGAPPPPPAAMGMRKHLLRARQRFGGYRMRLLQTLGGDIGDRIERNDHVVDSLLAMVENLHRGTDANGGEKRDDEHRNGAAQQRLCGQQAPIRRFGDRLRETLNGIRACRRTRHPGARH
jgi:hypothetical protein